MTTSKRQLTGLMDKNW